MHKFFLLKNSNLHPLNNLRNIDHLIKFGNHVRALRTARKMTLEQVAFAADVELSQIYRIEKGKINPTLTTLIALSIALQMSTGELLNTDFNIPKQ
jgi:transcriptional regulator with XRE-family HTH domain